MAFSLLDLAGRMHPSDIVEWSALCSSAEKSRTYRKSAVFAETFMPFANRQYLFCRIRVNWIVSSDHIEITLETIPDAN